MSRDGNGNYTRVPGSGYPNGSTADGPEVDAEMDDIATALTQSLSKDGQTVPTANLPMGGYRHTNVDDAAARTDYARADQVQDGTFCTLSSVSGADTITATAPVSMAAYVAGQQFAFVSAGANTGAVTLNINSIGAKAVTKRGATALTASDIASGESCVVQYDGTQFQLIGVPTQVAAASSTVAGVVELATDAEAQTGTDTARAITPANLAAVTSTETRAGVIELATSAEVTAGTDAVRAVTPATLASSKITLSTAQATTSGAQKIFTSIPSWVKRITLTLTGVSGTSTGRMYARIGTAGTPETSGYSGSVTVTTASTAVTSSSAGFSVQDSAVAAGLYSGIFTIVKHSGNSWMATFSGEVNGGAGTYSSTGSITLSGVLDCVSLEIASGAFDAGAVNAMWE